MRKKKKPQTEFPLVRSLRELQAFNGKNIYIQPGNSLNNCEVEF